MEILVNTDAGRARGKRAEVRASPGELVWRRHSDAVNRSWLSTCLAGESFGTVLKTDLFDEALEAGMYDMLRGRAERFIGIDLSSAVCGAARDRFPELDAVVADVRALPFEDGSADLVVSISTLDHFGAAAEIRRALEAIHRALRPGGRLLVTLDNPQNPAVWIRNLLPWRFWKGLGLVPYAVGATCGRGKLACLLRETGFEIVSCGAVMHCPRVLAVLAARVLARLRRPGSEPGFLGWLARFEKLAPWPARFYTGHFVAVEARKAGASVASR